MSPNLTALSNTVAYSLSPTLSLNYSSLSLSLSLQPIPLSLSLFPFHFTLSLSITPFDIDHDWLDPLSLILVPLALLLNVLTLAGAAVSFTVEGLWKLMSLSLAGLTSLFVLFQRHSPDVTAGCAVLPILTYNSTLNSMAAA